MHGNEDGLRETSQALQNLKHPQAAGILIRSGHRMIKNDDTRATLPVGRVVKQPWALVQLLQLQHGPPFFNKLRSVNLLITFMSLANIGPRSCTFIVNDLGHGLIHDLVTKGTEGKTKV